MMLKRTKLLWAAAVIVLAAFWFSGCDSGTAAPSAPIKTPEQLAAEALEEARKIACTQTSIEVAFLQGGFPAPRWASKDDVIVRADPRNQDGATLAVSCDPPYSREASWTLLLDSSGLRCTAFGSVRGLQWVLNCAGDGIVVALVTHVSQGKVFKGESVGLVSGAGVSSRAPRRNEVRLMVLQEDGSLREPTSFELALAARARRDAAGRSR